jgi:GxxExxY protein
MHPFYHKANALTEHLIAAAIEVHKDKGPGLVESIYEWCMLCELQLRQLAMETQRIVPISYKGFHREEPLRFDVLVEGCVLIEGKAVERILPIHQAQLLSYMKLLNVPIGLLINFNVTRLVDGVTRLTLPGADR